VSSKSIKGFRGIKQKVKGQDPRRVFGLYLKSSESKNSSTPEKRYNI